MHHSPPADWQKLAELVETWKRFPPDPEQQVSRITALFASMSSPDSVKGAAWLLSRDLRSRQVDLETLVALIQLRTNLPDWLIHYALEVNTDKAEAIAELDQAKAPSPWEALTLLQLSLQLKNNGQKEKIIASAWDHCQARGRWLFNKIILGQYTTPISPVLVYKAISLYLKCPLSAISAAIQSWDPFTQSLDFLAGDPKNQGFTAELPVLLPITSVDSDAPDMPKGEVKGLLFPGGLRRGWLHYKQDQAVLSTDEGVLLANFKTAKHKVMPELFADVFYEVATGKNAKIEKVWLHDLPELFLYKNFSWPMRQSVLLELKEALSSLPIFLLPVSITLTLDPPTMGFQGHQELIVKEGWDGYALQLKPAKKVAKAMLLYVKRSNLEAGAWEELTLGMRHPQHADLVPIARWNPPADWPHLEEWQTGTKNLLGERFGPVTTIRSGWLVEIEFDQILPSRKHKSGYFIHNLKILNWKTAISPDEADDVVELFKNY
ncbi:MAG TPA: hypothetical protein PLQ57_03850 [Saprospiraceae bacterium]|nr:hypothetical protein [Saprospiraceae bacterium]HRG64246.1 hypothetical protein [Saprospiraceae bacterium]